MPTPPSAAFRNHMHWSEFVGGDVIISPPDAWQICLNASYIEVTPRIDAPVEENCGRTPEDVRQFSARLYRGQPSQCRNLIHLELAAALCASSLLHVMILTIYSGPYPSKSRGGRELDSMGALPNKQKLVPQHLTAMVYRHSSPPPQAAE